MKQLLTFNTSICHSAYTASLSKDPKTKVKPKFNLADYYSKSNFLNHCTTLFSQVPLVKNEAGLISMKNTFLAIPDPLMTTEGEISKQSVQDLIIFVAEANRSKLAAVAATKDSTLGGMTPIFMYAHKLYNDVQYGEWDKMDDFISLALGKYLYTCWGDVSGHAKVTHVDEKINLDGTKEEIVTWKFVHDVLKVKPELTHEMVRDLRTELQTVISTGEVKPVADYKMKPSYMINCISYSGHTLRQELQTWIANVEKRNVDALILDMWDWDNIPEPWDVHVPQVSQKDISPWR